ncbi:cytochrome P450 [Actinophytocola sediminis]
MSDGQLSIVDLSTVDLTDPVLHAEGDPHAVWQAMRAREPVRWQQVRPGLGFWSVTRFAEADEVLRDHTRFTSQRGTMLTLLGKDDPAGGRQMAATDPPKHTAMREPLQRALSPRRVEQHAPRIREAIRTLLAPALDGGPMDFAQAMIMLPMTAAGTIMDLPTEDWPRLTELTTTSIAPDDPEFQGPAGPQKTLEAAHRELFAYFQDIVARRRRAPGEDLISLLLGMEIDGRRLGTGEILSNCYSLLLGANVTTPYVPNAAVAELAGTPRMADLLASTATIATAVEESLRWASPASHFMRYAVRDVVLCDTRIEAGEAVVVWLGSANRDESVFTDPFTFDLRRRPNRHMAFGAGPHYCVGHTVARLSLRLLFEELVATFEDIEPAGEPARLRSNFVAGIKHLDVVATVRANPTTN